MSNLGCELLVATIELCKTCLSKHSDSFGDVLVIDPSAKISKFADIEDSIHGSTISVGAESNIDSFVRFRAAGGTGSINIGRRCYINSGCVLYIGNGIRIHDYVSIGANCVFAPTNHEFLDRSIPIQFQGFRESKGGIVIEDDVWIGAGTVLLDGATVRRGAIVAAMSLVRGEVASYTIVGGNPLRKISERPH